MPPRQGVPTRKRSRSNAVLPNVYQAELTRLDRASRNAELLLKALSEQEQDDPVLRKVDLEASDRLLLGRIEKLKQAIRKAGLRH
jgi:hypothetical protein